MKTMKKSQENFTRAHDDYESGQKKKAGDLRAEGDRKEKPTRAMKKAHLNQISAFGELSAARRADVSPGPSRTRGSLMVDVSKDASPSQRSPQLPSSRLGRGSLSPTKAKSGHKTKTKAHHDKLARSSGNSLVDKIWQSQGLAAGGDMNKKQTKKFLQEYFKQLTPP